MGTGSPGKERAFNMTFKFDGQTFMFQDIQFTGNESGWFQKPNTLPQTYIRNSTSHITLVLQVLSDATLGPRTIQATAYALDSFGTQLTSSAPVTFTVQTPLSARANQL
jgi:hypothetical protein